MELCCGADPKRATCPDVCGMTMECGHVCPLPCHKRSSHQVVQCDQPCTRTCPEDHPCRKKCWEVCGNCLVPMDKKLPCDHVKTLRCFVKVEDAFCPVPVEKILPCQHKKELKCSEDINVKCYENCDKIICNDEHRCEKKCFEPCNPCHIKVDRKLACGHTQKTLCRIPPEEIVCRETKKCTFPDCGHKGKMLCGIKVEDAKCSHPCDRRMDCGHLCTLKCHVKADPDHEKYKCMKQCESGNKNCHRNHRCGRKCYEECQLCPVTWKRKLTCGHSLVLPCHLSDEDAQSYCKVNVRKTIAECGHYIDVHCGYKPTRADCKERCSSKLECGHDCVKKCCDPCTSDDCTDPVRLDSANFCGHPITLPCEQVAGADVTSDEVKKVLLLECNEECTAILDCGHLCRGTCGSCFSGRFHVPCEQKCGRILVCGHR